MSTRHPSYDRDLVIAWIVRLYLFVSIAFLAIGLMGCDRFSLDFSGAVKPSIIDGVGQDAQTRNSLPP